MTRRLQVFFGDDWEETFDSIRSAPGAIGGLALSGLRQLRPLDFAAFAFVLAGLLWLPLGYGWLGHHSAALVALAALPTLLWLAAGLAGGLIFIISGLGYRTFGYWEAYVLMVVFTLFGVASLRVALSPRGGRIYRGAPKTPVA